MIDTAIFYYPRGGWNMQLKIHMQYSLDLTMLYFFCLYMPNDLDKTFDLPNKDVLKYRKYLHWYHVKLMPNIVFHRKDEN